MTDRRGVWYAIAAAVLFGASTPFAKALVHGTSPQLFAGLLYLGSGIGLAIVAAIRHAERRRTEARMSRPDAFWLAGAILFGGIIGPVLLMIGLVRTPASSASLLLNLEGVFTASIAWFIARENFDRRIALGMLAIVLGGLTLAWEGRAEFGGFAGPVAVAGACLCWGIDNNLTQKVAHSDPLYAAMFKGLVAGVVNVLIGSTIGVRWPAIPIVGASMVLGFASYGVSLVLFVLALRHLGTARTAAYFSLAPFIGAALAIIVWRERPTVYFAAGAACMAVGVWLHLTERHSHEHAHDPMEHAHAHIHDEHHQHAHGPEDPPVTDPKPHSHRHRHERLIHTHPHYPDLHHRHPHD